MRRAAALTILKTHEAELKQLVVEHLFLFGSTAQDEAREDSDIDLFFDHPEGSLGLFALMDVKDAAARILGRKTDIMTRGACIGCCGLLSKILLYRYFSAGFDCRYSIDRYYRGD